jgi:hypothetical protein
LKTEETYQEFDKPSTLLFLSLSIISESAQNKRNRDRDREMLNVDAGLSNFVV